MIDTLKPKLNLPTKANFKTTLPLLGGADLSFWLALAAKSEERLIVMIANHQNELNQLDTELSFLALMHMFFQIGRFWLMISCLFIKTLSQSVLLY
ncbi:Transcription-repair coupling factor [Moraxella catarrhalis]|nr:Transcription-repair coupling factor [Moraxella catarrhalis]